MVRNNPVIWVVISVCWLSAGAESSERKLTGPEIEAALTNHTVEGEDGGRRWQQIFQPAGNTFYSMDGNQSQGHWQVRGDQYCSQWPPSEAWSCYNIQSDGTALVFISASGKRLTGHIAN